MNFKNKNISLCLGVSKKTPDLSVAISIPFKDCAPCCLKKLLNNSPAAEPELMKGSEESALGFALFEAVRDKLVGSPLEASKSRVSNLSCKSLNGNFIIYYNCQGTGTILRKTLGLILSVMHPHKLFSKYSENIKFLGGKVNKEHFNFVVNKMGEGVKKEIHIVAIGKINTSKEKVEDILKVLVSKIPEQHKFSAKDISEPPKRECKSKMYPTVKCSSGIACAGVADYIRNNSAGMGVEVHNGVVEIYNLSWESKHKQIKDVKRINDYVSKKYEKLGAEFSAMFGYFIATQKFADVATLSKIIMSKIKPSELKDLIKKSL